MRPICWSDCDLANPCRLSSASGSGCPPALYDIVTYGLTVTYGAAPAIRIVFALLLAITFTALPAVAQVREIDPNGLYPAGTRLSSPLTGIAFRLPDGFRAEWDPSIGGLVALANDGALGVVWGWSEGTPEEVASEVGSRLDTQGITLQVRGEPVMTPDGLRAVFDAMTDTGRGVLHALIRAGPDGGVIAVAGLNGAGAEATAEAFVDGVEASLEWTRPGAAALREQVVGTVLSWGGSGSDRATLSFCSPARYAYQESSDQHTGGWWLVADLAGTPTLFLEATDGRTFEWSVEESGDGFLIDGDPYRVTGTC